MATLPPVRKCMVCGEPLRFEAVNRPNPRRLMRPTEYKQLSHKCAPDAVAAWKEKVGLSK